MGFSRQEYWSGLPFPSPGDLLIQGSNPGLLPGRQILYCWATWGACPCVFGLNWQNQTEALSDTYMSTCHPCMHINHPSLSLQLLDAGFEEEKEISPLGPKSSCFILSENHSFKHCSTSPVVATGFELHGIKAKLCLWDWNPQCGSFQVKGLRGSDTSFFYKTDFSSCAALGLSLIVVSWPLPNCQTRAGIVGLSPRQPEPDLCRK